MWDYICVFIFPHHLFGNLVFTATSVHFVQAFLIIVFFASLFHHLCYVPSFSECVH